jgi:hypothetical protein
VPTSEIHACVLFERPSGRASATYYDFDPFVAPFELACLWHMMIERAELEGWTGCLRVTDRARARSVVLTYPPISDAERARSDEAHARTVAEAIVMLAG